MKHALLTQQMQDIADTLVRRGYEDEEVRAAMREWAESAAEKAIAWGKREDAAMERAYGAPKEVA